MKRIVIIGGGISGLATAHRLAELAESNHEHLQIILLEATKRLGGIVHTEERDGFLIERGPDSFISEKPEAIDLARRLQLESRLIETSPQNRRSFIVRRGRLRPVPAGFQLLAPARIWPFITTDIFSLSGKLRMAGELLVPRRDSNGTGDESLADFVRRRLGQEALERMAQPMVGGIYTADPNTLSLRATLPRFLDMERDHRSLILGMLRKERTASGQTASGARYSLFLSFDRGMRVLVDELARKISAYCKPAAEFAQVEVRMETVLEKLSTSEGTGWQLTTDGSQTITADAVCLAVPSFVAASALRELNPRISQELANIQFASTATVNLAYRRADIKHELDGFGFVVPFIEKRALIACTFSSIKFRGRAPENHVLLRAFVGGALQPEMFELDEAEIINRVQSDLTDLLGVSNAPLFARVTKWKDSMPQYTVGHLGRIAQIEEQIKELRGLTLAGNSYRGAGIPDCIRSGEAVAESLFRSLGSQ